MSATTWLIIPVLCVATALFVIPACAEDARHSKPVCTAKIRGKIWPEKTSANSAVPTEMCAPRRFSYRWQQLTVDVSELRADAARKPVIAGLAIVTRTKTGSAVTPPN
jgi:hypothetical protein